MQDNNTSTAHTPASRRYLAMAFSSAHLSASKPPTSTTNMQGPQLPTPEEPMLDSFEQRTVLPPIHIAPSPPASPAFRGTADGEFGHHDRILYPDLNGAHTTSADRPLFDSNPNYRWASPEGNASSAAGSAVSSPRSPGNSPFVLDGDSVLQARPSTRGPVMEAEAIGPVAMYNRCPEEYYRLMRRQMDDHRSVRNAHNAHLSNRRLPPLNSVARHLDPFSKHQISILDRGRSSNRVEKHRPSPRAALRPKAARIAPPGSPPKIESAPKRSRRQQLSPEVQSAVGAWQQSAAPKPRTRAAPSKKVDDKDYSEWASIPDHSPPTDSLDAGGKRLSATWNNSNALNLENDPDRQHLHPQEYEIASTLRLKCNQYLASKRRIFASKYKATKEGREFNKTSAQNCCTIDVNKASRLWMAFDGVGWLDDHWFLEQR